MLKINPVKKMCVLGFCLSILSSPLAIANNSIELNKDRSAGHGVIIKPQSHVSTRAALYTKNDLIYDKGDRQPDQEFMSKSTGKSFSKANVMPEDLIGQGR